MRTGYRFLLVFMLVSLLLFSSMPNKTSAIPYKIEGYLKDSNGMPITLASISITGRFYNSSAQGYQTATTYVTTDPEGYFKLYIPAAEPGGYEFGTEMTVSYRAGDDVVTKVVTIQGTGLWANLTSENKPGLLDALSSPVGIIIIVILISVIVIGYSIHRSSVEKNNPLVKEEEKPKRVERRRRQR